MLSCDVDTVICHCCDLLQFVSLLCGVGQSTSRTVPIKNAGNLPVTVNLEAKADRDFFFPHPSVLQMAPGEVFSTSCWECTCSGVYMYM